MPAPAKPITASIIPSDWMPAAKMQWVIVHWTAGTHTASENDRSHYHILIEGSGKPVRGIPSIKLNEVVKVGSPYAGHTLNCNTGAIGVSMCCMGGAVESPFSAAKYPMTRTGDTMTSAVADLCRRYSIPATDTTVLSHAEVQNNLGIQQRGKWDFTRLAFDPTAVGGKACGDKMRAEVRAKFS